MGVAKGNSHLRLNRASLEVSPITNTPAPRMRTITHPTHTAPTLMRLVRQWQPRPGDGGPPHRERAVIPCLSPAIPASHLNASARHSNEHPSTGSWKFLGQRNPRLRIEIVLQFFRHALRFSEGAAHLHRPKSTADWKYWVGRCSPNPQRDAGNQFQGDLCNGAIVAYGTTPQAPRTIGAPKMGPP